MKKTSNSPNPRWLTLTNVLRPLGLLIPLCVTPAAFAVDFTVTTLDDEAFDNGTVLTETADGTGLSLREAIGLANGIQGDLDDDTVNFTILGAGAPVITLTLGEITITDDIAIDGALGLGATVQLDGGNASRIFTINTSDGEGTNKSVVINGTTFEDGVAADGGAIFIAAGSTLIATDSNFNSNTATGAAATNGGGAIFNDGGTLTITGGSITGNTATGTSGSGGGIFSTDGAVTLEGVTIASNVANRAGGGIETIDGTLVLTNVTLGGSTAADGNIAGPDGTANPGNGGGLHISGATTSTINGGTVQFNLAAREGGGLWNQAGVTMEITDGTQILDNTAQGNDATAGGGGIFNNGGVVRVLNTTNPTTVVSISRNTASGLSGSGGGILNASGGSILCFLTIFEDNVANRAGGGIEDASGFGPTSFGLISGVTMRRNNAGVAPAATAAPGNGGAVHTTGTGNFFVFGCIIEDNIAASEGGGLWNDSGTMAINGSLTGNRAEGTAANNGGGAIFNEAGILTIAAFSGRSENSLIADNIAAGAAGSGGGIFNNSPNPITITNVTFRANTANRAGGAIEVVGGTETTLTSCSFEDNVGGVDGSANPGNGGAIHITGNGIVTTNLSSYANNTAANEGGALWNSGAGTMNVISSTLRGNSAPAGGGIFNDTGAGVTQVTNSTVSGNTSPIGAGTQIDGGSMTFLNSTVASNNGFGVGVSSGTLNATNTIFGDNTEADVSGAFTTAIANLVEDASAATGLSDPSNIVGQDPKLAPLADNGVTAISDFPPVTLLTHLLGATSPGYNAGNNAAASELEVEVDQRGADFPRVLDGTIDIGALEARATNYAEFVENSFGTFDSASDKLSTADPDNDGLSNALEFLTGSDPKEANPSPFVVAANGSEVSFSYPRQSNIPLSAVVELLELSENLVDFDVMASSSPLAVPTSSTFETITMTLPTSEFEKLFARLTVTIP